MMMPATTPEPVSYSIDLPFPVSANRLWRSASTAVHTRRGTYLSLPRVHVSPQYKSWIKEADALYLIQKRKLGPIRTLGRYTLACTFSRDKRSPIQDGDNLCKCVHDWLQRIELIHNDCLCEGGSWAWGDAQAGCLVLVEGYPWVS